MVSRFREKFHLRVLLVKLYAVGHFGDAVKLLLRKVQFQHAVWAHNVEIDALFGIVSPVALHHWRSTFAPDYA